MRILALELARITEATAIAAAEWIGRRDGKKADGIAVEVMRTGFNNLDIDGTVVIGEGERDKAPMLFIGERLGNPDSEHKVDIAVDPLEGTNSVAYGRNEAMVVMALGGKGDLLQAPDVYMKKIAVGPRALGVVDINASVADNIEAVARALNKDRSAISVMVLDRERHLDLIQAISATGAKVHTIPDGDVSACMATCMEESGIDMYLGVGGAPEGVLAASALRCIGGQMWGRLTFRNDDERGRATRLGISDFNKIYTMNELAHGEVMFAATGVTDGSMLRGVRRWSSGASTQSIIMRSKTGTVRTISAEHNFSKKSLVED